MSDINITVNDEIVNIDVIDTPVYVEVTNSPGPAGPAGVGVPVGGTTGQVLAKNSATNYDTAWVSPSGGTWGTITGTLSNQTDLQNALNAKFDDPTGTTAQYLRGDGSLATFPALTGYVPYTGATANVDLGTHTILAQNATIASSGSGDTATITHSSGSGIGLNITKGGNGEGLYINKTGGSGNAATILGTLNATTLVKSGGTSSQFLKADGTTDSNAYVPTSRTITINGVTFDLSADRSYTVAAGISGSGTSGQVTYWTGSSAVSGSNNLFWDNANGRLGIGTNAPAAKVDINLGAGSNTNSVYIRNTSSTGYSSVTMFDNRNNNSFVGQWGLYGDAFVGNISNMFFYNTAGGGIGFYVGSGSNPSADLRLIIGNNGNIGIGTGTTVPAVRFQVSGDTLLRGSGATSATTALTVQNSASTNLFVVRNDGNVGIGTNAPTNLLTIGVTPAASLLQSDATFYSTSSVANVFTLVSASSTDAFRRPVFGGVRARGTLASPSSVLAGDFITSFFAGAYDGSAIQNSAGLSFDAESNASSGSAPQLINLITGSTSANRTTKLQVRSNGNVLIQNGGTFTDNGQRLQVYGDTLLRGSGNTNATTALTVQNSSSTNLFRVFNNGDINIGGGTQDYVFAKRANLVLTLQSQLTGTLQQTEYYTKDGDGTDDNGFAIFARGTPSDITNFEQFRYFYSASLTSYVIGTNKGGTGVFRDIRIGNSLTPTDLVVKADTGNVLLNTTTDVASSILTISSTTKGLLPPRMTTTQKNAIATPAAGLVVYDTTDNKHYGYNGTTWNAFY